MVPEKAKKLLEKFIRSTQDESYVITKELQKLGFMIWIGDDEYSIVPTWLSEQLLTREFEHETLFHNRVQEDQNRWKREGVR